MTTLDTIRAANVELVVRNVDLNECIRKAKSILLNELNECNFFYTGSKWRTPQEKAMKAALDALEGK